MMAGGTAPAAEHCFDDAIEETDMATDSSVDDFEPSQPASVGLLEGVANSEPNCGSDSEPIAVAAEIEFGGTLEAASSAGQDDVFALIVAQSGEEKPGKKKRKRKKRSKPTISHFATQILHFIRLGVTRAQTTSRTGFFCLNKRLRRFAILRGALFLVEEIENSDDKDKRIDICFRSDPDTSPDSALPEDFREGSLAFLAKIYPESIKSSESGSVTWQKELHLKTDVGWVLVCSKDAEDDAVAFAYGLSQMARGWKRFSEAVQQLLHWIYSECTAHSCHGSGIRLYNHGVNGKLEATINKEVLQKQRNPKLKICIPFSVGFNFTNKIKYWRSFINEEGAVWISKIMLKWYTRERIIRFACDSSKMREQMKNMQAFLESREGPVLLDGQDLADRGLTDKEIRKQRKSEEGPCVGFSKESYAAAWNDTWKRSLEMINNLAQQIGATVASSTGNLGDFTRKERLVLRETICNTVRSVAEMVTIMPAMWCQDDHPKGGMRERDQELIEDMYRCFHRRYFEGGKSANAFQVPVDVIHHTKDSLCSAMLQTVKVLSSLKMVILYLLESVLAEYRTAVVISGSCVSLHYAFRNGNPSDFYYGQLIRKKVIVSISSQTQQRTFGHFGKVSVFKIEGKSPVNTSQKEIFSLSFKEVNAGNVGKLLHHVQYYLKFGTNLLIEEIPNKYYIENTREPDVHEGTEAETGSEGTSSDGETVYSTSDVKPYLHPQPLGPAMFIVAPNPNNSHVPKREPLPDASSLLLQLPKSLNRLREFVTTYTACGDVDYDFEKNEFHVWLYFASSLPGELIKVQPYVYCTDKSTSRLKFPSISLMGGFSSAEPKVAAVHLDASLLVTEDGSWTPDMGKMNAHLRILTWVDEPKKGFHWKTRDFTLMQAKPDPMVTWMVCLLDEQNLLLSSSSANTKATTVRPAVLKKQSAKHKHGDYSSTSQSDRKLKVWPALARYIKAATTLTARTDDDQSHGRVASVSSHQEEAVAFDDDEYVPRAKVPRLGQKASRMFGFRAEEMMDVNSLSGGRCPDIKVEPISEGFDEKTC